MTLSSAQKSPLSTSVPSLQSSRVPSGICSGLCTCSCGYCRSVHWTTDDNSHLCLQIAESVTLSTAARRLEHSVKEWLLWVGGGKGRDNWTNNFSSDLMVQLNFFKPKKKKIIVQLAKYHFLVFKLRHWDTVLEHKAYIKKEEKNFPDSELQMSLTWSELEYLPGQRATAVWDTMQKSVGCNKYLELFLAPAKHGWQWD